MIFFGRLGLSLNLEKCNIMTLNRIRSPIMFHYHLSGSINSCYGKFVMDLGFKLSRKLDPGLHIEMIYCKALRLGNYNDDSERFYAYFLCENSILLIDSGHTGIWCCIMGSLYRHECMSGLKGAV